MKRREDLANPRYRRKLNVPYEPGAFGRFSEAVARNLGTARFLVVQTFLVLVWISINVVSITLRWDPYPFILLNLMFSVQAAYAAPLILLAQNRQSDRDRVQYQEDRQRTERLLADNDYMARELAALRLALGEVATRDYVRSELKEMLQDIGEKIDDLQSRPTEIERP